MENRTEKPTANIRLKKIDRYQETQEPLKEHSPKITNADDQCCKAKEGFVFAPFAPFRGRLFALAITVLLFSIFADPVSAQNGTGINGRVTDAQGASVAGATVSLYQRANASEKLTTATNSQGEYRFEKLAAGVFLLEIKAVGFTRVTAKEVTIERSKQATLDVQLEIAGVKEEVVVIASSTPQTVDEVSKETTVIGSKEIETRDEYSIADALRTVPGLRVQQLGGPGRLTSIKARGLRNADTAVLIDGQRLRDAAGINGDALAFITDLLVTDIDRVEVLRGSGSSLYGTNAIGGVVNIVTDEGGGPTRGSFLLEGGSLRYLRGRATLAGSAADNRIAYSAGITHLNVARGIDDDDATRNTSAQGRALFRLSPTMTLSARLYATDSFVQLNNNADTVANLPATGIINAIPLTDSEFTRFVNGTPVSQLIAGNATFIPDANDPDNSSNSNFFLGSVTFTHRPFEKFGYTLSYQGLKTDRNNINGPGGIGFQPFGGAARSAFDGRIQTLNARADFQIGSWNAFAIGYEFENENYVNDNFEPDNTFSKVDVVQKSAAFFVQDQMRFFDNRLQLSAAFRAQGFTLERPQFTPANNPPYNLASFNSPDAAYTGDVSVAYFFAQTNTKIRAHVGNGYRVPSLFERFGTFFSSFSNSFTALGDPRLRSERSIAFDAGLDQSLASDRVRLSTTYFYTRLQEVIGFGAVPSPDPFGRCGFFGCSGYLNTGGGLARGVETSFAATPTRSLDLFASYTYTNSDQRAPQASGIISSFVTPDHQFTFVATQRVGQRITINFDFWSTSNFLAPMFSSTTFATRVYRFDGARKADLGASYTLPVNERLSLKFFGRVENLFDYGYYENGFRTPGATGRGGIVLQF
jgi:iron complex outermembrane receptor protein